MRGLEQRRIQHRIGTEVSRVPTTHTVEYILARCLPSKVSLWLLFQKRKTRSDPHPSHSRTENTQFKKNLLRVEHLHIIHYHVSIEVGGRGVSISLFHPLPAWEGLSSWS